MLHALQTVADTLVARQPLRASDWIAMAGLLSTATLGVVGFLVSWRREKHQQARDDRLRREQLAREDEIRSIQRTLAPRIEFSVDIEFVGEHMDHWIVELVAHVNNKGLVRHDIDEFAFDLRMLTYDDPLVAGDESINHQVRIPRLLKDGAWIPKHWEGTFIEPGVTTRYSHIASVPKAAVFVLLHGRFDYAGADAFHTADRLMRVPVHPLMQVEHAGTNSPQ